MFMKHCNGEENEVEPTVDDYDSVCFDDYDGNNSNNVYNVEDEDDEYEFFDNDYSMSEHDDTLFA